MWIGKTKLFVIALFCAFLGNQSVALAEISVAELLARHDESDQQAALVEYTLAQNHIGMGWANTWVNNQHEFKIYCPPDNLTLTGPQLVVMLREYAKDEKFGAVPYGFGLLLALSYTFPCQ